MGTERFSCETRGITPLQAFDLAITDAEHFYGSRGYTGTIAEKDDFIMIQVPKNKNPREYAYELLQKYDDRISNKWGPAGCILIEKNDYKYSKQVEVENLIKSGTKKWETIYKIIEEDLNKNKVIDQAKTKIEALKKAKKLAIKNQQTYKIIIDKILTNHDNLEAVIKPKELESNKGKQPGNLYMFFGFASC
jgi:hypothetical protein